VHVYALDGRYLGAAEPWTMAGFSSVEDAQKHARLTREIMRLDKRRVEALGLMPPSELARALPRIEAAEPPEPRLVRPLFRGAAALKPQHEADEEEDRFVAALRAEGKPRLRVVPNDPEQGPE
jgi:hypothetical protein